MKHERNKPELSIKTYIVGIRKEMVEEEKPVTHKRGKVKGRSWCPLTGCDGWV